MLCDAGNWPTEVSWSIFDESWDLVLSGGADETVETDTCTTSYSMMMSMSMSYSMSMECSPGYDEYTVEMYDSFGDGWNGV